MVNVSIARRYARALIDVALEAGALDPLANQLEALNAAFTASEELGDLLRNPAFTRAQRRAVLDGVLASLGSPRPELVNLVHLLIDRDRTPFLPDIARLFRSLADAHAGRVRGEVTSAVPLTPEVLARLRETLGKVTHKEVVLEPRVDPSLLGGLSAQVGSLRYDGSLKTQLRLMRRSLENA